MKRICFSSLLMAIFCFSSFTLLSQAVSLVAPTNTTVAGCQTQGQVDAEFNAWLSIATASGGCSGVLSNNGGTSGPASCGGTRVVTFIYTSSCAPTTTTATSAFVVAVAPAISLACPSNVTTGSCQTQAQVDAAFTTWLTTITASGGCNGALSNSGGTSGPNRCGGTKLVTFTYTSSCAPTTVTCSAGFTVAAARPVAVTVFGSTTTLGLNPTASQIDTALGFATATGGCGTTVTHVDSPVTRVNVFGRQQTRIFTVTDACGSEVTASRTVTWGISIIRLPNDYLTLNLAFADIGTTGITGPTIIELGQDYVSLYEAYPIVIGPIPGSSSTNTLTIRPAADANGIIIAPFAPFFDPNTLTFYTPPPKQITMDLQNASNVIIDGRPGGVGTQSQLTIQNFSIAGNAARFVYGANNNCIKYCTLEGANSPSNYTNSPAVVLYDSTGTKSDPHANGVLNIKDSIIHCIIRGSGDTTQVYNGIFSSGINDLNGSNVISNSEIADFSNAGILVPSVGNGGNWIISENSFYYDLPSPATSDQTAIQFTPGASSDNNTISDNFIGGSAANAGGNPWANTGNNGAASFTGIYAEGGITTGTTVQRNVFQNIFLHPPQTALFTGSRYGMLAANDGNIIGSVTNANSIQVSANNASATGIFINSDYSVSVKNDQIANISVSGGTTEMIACRKSGRGPLEFAQNNIFSLSATGGAATGILDEGTGDATISGNNINTISGSAVSDFKMSKPTDASSEKITANVLSGDASATGISVDVQNLATLNLTVQNNTINGFSKGILLTKSSGATLNTSIFDNAITGNTLGIDNETAAQTNATCNWWGSANGPAAGQISGNVLYSPWATILQYVSVNAGADQTIYTGFGPQSVTLTATTVACGTPQYLWSTGATSQSIVVSPATTTDYIVSVTDAGGHNATDTVKVIVINATCGNNNDKVLMCHKGGTICIKKADVPDHLKQGDQLGPCAGSLTQAVITGENILKSEFRIYPDPAKDKLRVEWFADEAKVQAIEVFDLLGRKLLSQKIIQLHGINNNEIDVSRLNSGAYFMKMLMGKEVKIARFVVKK